MLGAPGSRVLVPLTAVVGSATWRPGAASSTVHTFPRTQAPHPCPVPSGFLSRCFWVSITVSSLRFQGIQFLIENDLLKNTCEDIAQFLYKGEGLNKTAIGDYLGER